ncbi:MAG TPA: FeoB-associated Cys-rich membrane protein [Verrucomicrobiae bacterium]|nr:FeoB-associated Cys-rich membrane protein [Verrucomicrobiae bacterium]
MGFADLLIMAVILAASGYLLYRSLWKKKGHCQGCSDHGCSSRK